MGRRHHVTPDPGRLATKWRAGAPRRGRSPVHRESGPAVLLLGIKTVLVHAVQEGATGKPHEARGLGPVAVTNAQRKSDEGALDSVDWHFITRHDERRLRHLIGRAESDADARRGGRRITRECHRRDGGNTCATVVRIHIMRGKPHMPGLRRPRTARLQPCHCLKTDTGAAFVAPRILTPRSEPPVLGLRGRRSILSRCAARPSRCATGTA